MTISKIYKSLKVYNDIKAIKKGRIVNRVMWRISGKITGKLFGSWFK